MIFPHLIDLHIHSAPDIRPRRHTDLELAAAARTAEARAIVIKSHHVPTMDRAWHTSQATPGLTVFGGLALNWPAGGLNTHAVAAALHQGAKIVWLPTLHARNHRSKEGLRDGIEVTRDGRVVEALKGILEQIAEADAILATGHIGADEIPLVVAAALERKVRKIVITHPEHDIVGLSLDLQKSLLRDCPTVVFERHYAQPDGKRGYKMNFATNLLALKELGAASTVLATDAGQVENLPWAQCWERYLAYLREHGVNETDLARMCADTPAALLNLPPARSAASIA
ncbi:MAG: DUF6282 family protein [Lacunisphaera sp.]|nr:DUF6282 family protein [Lacunisphaera sp.]